MAAKRQRKSRNSYISQIDFIFYHEKDLREAVSEARLDSGHTVKKPESWLIVIDKTYSWCKLQKDCRHEIARRRYSGEDYRQTCRDLNISNSTRRRLLELVKIYAALQAVQLGLIQV